MALSAGLRLANLKQLHLQENKKEVFLKKLAEQLKDKLKEVIFEAKDRLNVL